MKYRALVLSEFASSSAAHPTQLSDMVSAVRATGYEDAVCLTVVKPAILFRSLLDWITATSSATLLFV